ncbi:chorismate synthase, partial [Belliella pelovolcani]|uniref:chorismate synthase n=1 Tax=Belliella pelovolcani TaxID=529505 RepID=UPI00391B4CAE
MGNSFGKIFKISTFGESHGKGLGVVLEGCPAGLAIDEDFIRNEMQRRKPGQSKITTQRKEEDEFQILSGVFEGKSTGTPIGMVIMNTDQKSKDYGHISDKFRPSHADFTYFEKYRIRDYRGGGRSSARETAARVAAGAIAKMFL